MKSSQILKIIINKLQERKPIPKKFKKNIKKFKYFDYGQIDSLEIMNFILFLEKKFKIKISNKNIISNNFREVGGLVEIIKKKIKP